VHCDQQVARLKPLTLAALMSLGLQATDRQEDARYDREAMGRCGAYGETAYG